MRLVQISVPTGKRSAVVHYLQEEEIDFTLTNEVSDNNFDAVVNIPLPAEAVESVLDDIRDLGVNDEAITVVLQANSITSRRYDALEERFAKDESESDRIGRTEITGKSKELMPSMGSFLLLTVISAVVATAGLLLDSPAVVIGSMVIAPLVGPALSASVGTVTNDETLRDRGVLFQVFGVIAAIMAATTFAWLVQAVNIVPPGLDITTVGEIEERLVPDFLALVIAIGAGIAGAWSLTAGVSTALVGVMIAAALIPPAGVAGISLAWGEYTLALGSGILVAINILSINVAALTVLWMQGYRPERWYEKSSARRSTQLRVGALIIGILALSVFLAGVSFAGYQAAVHEETVDQETQDLVDEYEQLTLLDTQITTDQHPLRGEVDTVVVTVGEPEDFESPPLAEELGEQLDTELSEDIDVEVRFIESQHRGSSV